MGRPRERSPLFGGVYVLVPIWLGAPRPAWRPDPLVERGPAGFLGRYLVTVLYIGNFIEHTDTCSTPLKSKVRDPEEGKRVI